MEFTPAHVERGGVSLGAIKIHMKLCIATMKRHFNNIRALFEAYWMQKYYEQYWCIKRLCFFVDFAIELVMFTAF